MACLHCSASFTDVERAGIHGLKSWGRKLSRKVRGTRSSSSQKRPEQERKYWQRVEPGIHGLNRWAVNCLEMSGKRGVQTDKTPRARTEVLAAPRKPIVPPSAAPSRPVNSGLGDLVLIATCLYSQVW